MIKHIKAFIPVALAFLTMSIMCHGKKDPEPGACDYAIQYKRNGQWNRKTETQVTAEIWPASSNNLGKKVYDIWSDQTPGFYFHSSASAQGQTSGLVTDWLQTEGSHLIIDGQVITGQFTFQIIQEASNEGDLVKITFSGTTGGGDQIQEGQICTYIDILH